MSLTLHARFATSFCIDCVNLGHSPKRYFADIFHLGGHMGGHEVRFSRHKRLKTATPLNFKSTTKTRLNSLSHNLLAKMQSSLG